MSQNILDKQNLISELKQIHKELVKIYSDIFKYKFEKNEAFQSYIKEQYKENGVSTKDQDTWNKNFCHRAAYTLLNKILFVRICEDKGFMRNSEDYIADEIDNPHIGEKLSKRGLQKWTSIITNYTLGELIKFAFLDMQKSYNNIVLYKDDKYEILNPTDEELNLKYLDGDKSTKEFVVEFEKILNDIIEKLDTDKFNFEKADGNILGDVYEKFMDRDTRKAIGQFYTPNFVIEYILNNTVAEADVVENPFVTVADISCGSGHFLIMAYDILKEKFINNLETLREKYADETYKIIKNGQEEELSGKEYWKEENIHYHLLKHCIYGADIDSFAVQLTTINLLLKDLDNFTDELNIIECDSLIKWEEDYDWQSLKEQLEEKYIINKYVNVDLFGNKQEFVKRDERKEFILNYKNSIGQKEQKVLDSEQSNEMLKIGKFWSIEFDYIIGNPPYIRYEKINEKVINYVKSRYETAYKFFDIFSIFIERNIGKCKNNQYLSLITPNLYIRGSDYNKLRKYILENSKDINLNDLGDNVFQDVQMPTAIIKIHKDKRKIIEGSNFMLFESDSIIGKLKQNKRLEEICEIQRGLELGKSVLYNKERKNSFKILTGEDIERYGIKSLKYIDESLIEQNNKEDKYFSLDRVLIRETGNRITTVFVDEKIYSLRSLYSIISNIDTVDPRALSGILNSDLIQYFYFDQFKSNTDIFPKIRVGQVKQIPICITEESILKKVASKVTEIQNLKRFLLYINEKIKDILINIDDYYEIISNLIKLLEKQDRCIVELIDLEEEVNNIVYELYDINETEILKIRQDLGIKYYKLSLEELEDILSINEFLDAAKKHDLYEMSNIYNYNIRTIVELRHKYMDVYTEINPWNFYNTEDVFNVIYSIVKDIIKSIFNEKNFYIHYKETKEIINESLFNFKQLINIIRQDKHNVKSIDVIKDALNTDAYTWNAYRKDKAQDKVNKIFIKYYDNNYYGLAEWSDEVHKKYFMDAIEEYTVNSPNQKKAKDILKLFEDLDIEDKQDYIEIIEGKIKRTFN